MNSSFNDVANIAANIIVLSIVAAVALIINLAGLIAGVITGGAVGFGHLGFQAAKGRKTLDVFDERVSVSGNGPYGPDGVFVGEEERWQ